MTPACCSLAIRRWIGCLIALCAALVVTAFTPQAKAQASTMYLDRLEIGGAPEDGFAVWRPRPGEKTRFYGQFALGYTLHELRGDVISQDPNRKMVNAVDHRLINYLSAGVEILNRVSIGLTMPIVWYGAGGNARQDPNNTGSRALDMNHTVPSDLRLDGRVRLFSDRSNSFHLGIAGAVYIPSGDKISWTTDDRARTALRLTTELDLKSIIVALNTGLMFRPDRSVFALATGNEWFWAAGLYVPLRDGKMRIGAEIFGSTGISSATNGYKEKVSTTFTKYNTPLEWLAQVRIALDKEKAAWLGAGAGTRMDLGYGAPDLRVLASLGYQFSLKDTDPNAPGRRYEFNRELEPKSVDTDKDGIPDDLDLCPTVPEDKQPPDASDGCPAPQDRDHDGIPDESDKCPDQPEDKDGIDDLDGCPEDDFDVDGIPDATDACPREPGKPNPDPKKNGCPEFIRHIEGSTEIQILKKVEFATGSAVLLPTSFPILDEVMNLMKANKDIARVSVEGHTDSRGNHEMNMKLSDDRAASVVRYLVGKGIAAGRLESHGYGPDKPIDTNDTDAGRQKNRRVEFHIKQ